MDISIVMHVGGSHRKHIYYMYIYLRVPMYGTAERENIYIFVYTRESSISVSSICMH